MDDKITGLYAAGLTVRDIQAHLLDLYGLRITSIWVRLRYCIVWSFKAAKQVVR
jgi:hypothetical protein